MDLHTKTNDNGTIKLSYTVSDGSGAKVKATNSFELEAVNDAAELTGDQATLAKGKEDNAYILQESDLLKELIPMVTYVRKSASFFWLTEE